MAERTIMSEVRESGENPQVKELGTLLQYQDGSIVSRLLLKNKGGTVTERAAIAFRLDHQSNDQTQK
jgi:hypothetical protein